MKSCGVLEVPLHHPNCLDKSLWANPGIMSEMLVEIRDELNGVIGDNTTDSSSEMETGTDAIQK